jgi:hypothetical protein
VEGINKISNNKTSTTTTKNQTETSSLYMAYVVVWIATGITLKERFNIYSTSGGIATQYK